MTSIDEMINEFTEEEGKNEKPDYEKTNQEKREELKKKIKEFTDWMRLPLNILIAIILLIGMVLMYFSIYALTGNQIVSFMSPAFTELGIIGWEFARERTKNTERQTSIASNMRWWHVLMTVTLLVTNFAIETMTAVLNVKIDGVIWIVFVAIGLTALLDLVFFFVYNDNDRDGNNKKEFSKKIETLKAQTVSKKLDAYARAEEIRANALVNYWEQNSADLAELTGRIQAAAQIKNEFLKSGLTEHEIDSVLQKITRKTATNLIPELTDSEKSKNTETPEKEVTLLTRTKRKYNKKSKDVELDDKKVGEIVGKLDKLTTEGGTEDDDKNPF